MTNMLEPFLGSHTLRGLGVNCVHFAVYLLVSGALLVAVTVSSAARAGSAAMPPPPLPGARARAAPVSRCGARAPPSAVTRTGSNKK